MVPFNSFKVLLGLRIKLRDKGLEVRELVCRDKVHLTCRVLRC